MYIIYIAAHLDVWEDDAGRVLSGATASAAHRDVLALHRTACAPSRRGGLALTRNRSSPDRLRCNC